MTVEASIEEDDDPLGLSSWPDALDRDLAMPAFAAFYEVVGGDGDVEILLVSDFETEVKARLPSAEAAVYVQARGAYGTAMAKTLPRSDGSSIVLFDIRLFVRGMPSPPGMFRHEAFHVLLNRAGENTSGITGANDIRRLADGIEAHPDVVAMAGIMLEEYRVQRATYERFPAAPYADFEALCEAAHDSIQAAAVSYFLDQAKNVQPVRDAVLMAFAALTTQAGYIAAQLEIEGRSTPALDDPDLHNRMLGKSWVAVIAHLRLLPSAAERVARAELDAAVQAGALLLDAWLHEMGFGMEVLDERTTFFHVHEHQDWVIRGPARAA